MENRDFGIADIALVFRNVRIKGVGLYQLSKRHPFHGCLSIPCQPWMNLSEGLVSTRLPSDESKRDQKVSLHQAQ
jgi:hypothetical protein